MKPTIVLFDIDGTLITTGGVGRRAIELAFEELLPSPHDGPDALLERQMLLDALEVAIHELPRDQRDVFVAHELDGKSFKQISGETGVSVNTLLSRKHYAVLRLREALQSTHDELSE